MGPIAMIRQEFLELLRCPESQQKLVLADGSLIARLNQAIAAGTLCNRAGEPVEQKIDGALVREDQSLAYPIIDEIPILLQDEAIVLEQLAGTSSGES